MPFGAHMSIAGGMYHAFEEGEEAGCEALQVFTKSSNQWKAKVLTDEDLSLWREAWARHHEWPVVAHDSYLINMASPDEALWRKSIDAFHHEVERCDALGIPHLIMHPGAHMGAGEEAGLERVARAFDEVWRRSPRSRTRVLIETTAGQGTCLGWRFEHLRGVIDRVKSPDRLGVCLDTCHVFAAGYDFRTEAGYDAVMREFDRVVGIDQLRCFHLNDSKRELGSRVDRHEHIGKGHIGREAFRHIARDPRFRGLPMLLETPKEGGMDVKNLRLLRRLAREAPRASSRHRL
ncbi:MAG: deoxyribonuclease IV [Planctomycetota bacterium]